jgi:hypothetical protein
MRTHRRQFRFIEFVVVLSGLVVVVVIMIVLGVRRSLLIRPDLTQIPESPGAPKASTPSPGLRAGYGPRLTVDDLSGFMTLMSMLPNWKPESSLEELKNHWQGVGSRAIGEVDRSLADPAMTDGKRVAFPITKACLLNAEGETEKSYQLMHDLRAWVERRDALAAPRRSTARG